MNVLIIGGTGILGSALTREALRLGHDVFTIGLGPGLYGDSVHRYRHVEVDRNDHAHLDRALQATAIFVWDLVVDVCCYNSKQAVAMGEILSGRSTHTVVLSTAFVYDWTAPMPLTPQSPIARASRLGGYAAGKADMEAAWLEAHSKRSHPVTILRLPHVVARGADLGVIPLHNRDPLLLARLRQGVPLLLADGGRQLLHIVYADDVAQVILAVGAKDNTIGQVYNCANPEILTAHTYYELVAEVLKVPLRVQSVPVEAVWLSSWGWGLTALSRVLDTGALEADIGFVPTTPARAAIVASVRFLLESENREMSADLSIGEVAGELNGMNLRLAKAMSRAAIHQPQTDTNIARRMNQSPPCSCGPEESGGR